MSSRKALALAVTLGALALVTLRVLTGPAASQELTPVRIAAQRLASSALPILAYEAGIFEENGLRVEFLLSSPDENPLDALAAGNADLAVAYDTPVAHALLQGLDLIVLTELHSASRNTALVYRRDRGIEKPKDLEGKRIGVTLGTNADSFLEVLIRAHELDRDQLQIRSVPFDALASDLASGKLDAVVVWEPFTSLLIGDGEGLYQSLTLPFHSEVSILVTTRAYAEKHPDVIDDVLRSLLAALDVIEHDPEGAATKVERFAKANGIPVHPETWRRLQFGVGLGTLLQTLLREDMAWHRRREVESEGLDLEVDLTRHLAIGPMKRLLPERVVVP